MARSEAKIIDDITNLYARLSPENLYCDGERDHADAEREGKELNKKLKACFKELGREVSELEAYDLWERNREKKAA
jgi:hypothetical protein